MKKEAELEAQSAKTQAFLERKCLLEKAVEVHRSLAKSLVEDGKSKKPPPLDAAFVKKLKDYSEELESRRLEKLAALESTKLVEVETTGVAVELEPGIVAAELAPVAAKGSADVELAPVVVEAQVVAKALVFEPMPSAVAEAG